MVSMNVYSVVICRQIVEKICSITDEYVNYLQIQVKVFWVVTPFRFVVGYQLFTLKMEKTWTSGTLVS